MYVLMRPRLVCVVNNRMLTDLSSQSSRHASTADFETGHQQQQRSQQPSHRTSSRQQQQLHQPPGSGAHYRGGSSHHRSAITSTGNAAPSSLPVIPSRHTMADLSSVPALGMHTSLNPADAYSHTYMSILPQSSASLRHSSSYYPLQTSSTGGHGKAPPVKQNSVTNQSDSSSSGTVVGVCVQQNTVTASH